MRLADAQRVHKVLQPQRLGLIVVDLIGQAPAFTKARQVRRDDPVTGGQLPREIDPVVFFGENSVQQNHRFTAPAFQIVDVMHPNAQRFLGHTGELAIELQQGLLEEMGQPVVSGCESEQQQKGNCKDDAFQSVLR
jgi:hypothetical protein